MMEYQTMTKKQYEDIITEIQADLNCFWRTKDGTIIKISEMTDSHLKNSIAFLERASIERNIPSSPRYQKLIDELNKRIPVNTQVLGNRVIDLS